VQGEWGSCLVGSHVELDVGRACADPETHPHTRCHQVNNTCSGASPHGVSQSIQSTTCGIPRCLVLARVVHGSSAGVALVAV
jgi:hypothetical protein